MILVDTSVLFAFFYKFDSCHEQAQKIYKTIPNNKLVIAADVIKELLTIVNLRKGDKTAKQIYYELDQDPRNPFIHNLDALEFFEFMDFFREFPNTRLSTVDLQLLFLAQKYEFQILTFDKELIKMLPKELVYTI
jgi:predicted nucleic acid-binding protein